MECVKFRFQIYILTNYKNIYHLNAHFWCKPIIYTKREIEGIYMSINCHPWPYKKTVTKYKLELLADKKKSFNSSATVAHSVSHSEHCWIVAFVYLLTMIKRGGIYLLLMGMGLKSLLSFYSLKAKGADWSRVSFSANHRLYI